MQLKDFYAKLFAGGAPIRDLGELGKFIDEQAAFLVQKGIYEYSRARAGHYSKIMFREPAFLEAVEQSRWQAYPLGLAMIGELVEGVLRPPNQEDRGTVLKALSDVVLSIFDRYPLPAGLDAETWRRARGDLVERLNRIALHPPKPAMDIPEPLAKAYFALMPIHKSLRGSDFPTLTNYLRITMCNVHDELERRMDVKAMMDALLAHA